MKLLTITVPSYNSEDYLQNALDSLIPCLDELEVIIVNDGSKDRTLEIAEAFRDKYPNDVKVIDKENGGHGSGVMAGLRAGEGLFFYVLDSDDWLDTDALRQVLDRLKSEHERHLQGEEPLDLLICNYVYNKVGQRPYAIDYHRSLPMGRRFTWSEMKSFKLGTFLTMHSMIYRLDFLRGTGVELPNHTFYVDNLIAYVPLPHVKTIFYEDADLYQYFIGRDEQSVNRDVLIKRIDQHILVTKMVASAYHVFDEVKEPKLQTYMMNYLSILVTITISHLNMSKKPENHAKVDEFWSWLEAYDPKMYKYCKRDELNWIIDKLSKSDLGKKTLSSVYTIAQKIFRFN